MSYLSGPGSHFFLQVIKLVIDLARYRTLPHFPSRLWPAYAVSAFSENAPARMARRTSSGLQVSKKKHRRADFGQAAPVQLEEPLREGGTLGRLPATSMWTQEDA